MARQLRTTKWSFKKAGENFRLAIKQVPTNMKSYIWEIPVAVASYVLPASIAQLKGWGGWFSSVALTWSIGALLGSKTIRDFAWGFGGLHLTYSLASDSIAKMLGRPVWRMGDYQVTKIGEPTMAGMRGLRGYENNPAALQPNTKVIDLPGGFQATARPAVDGLSQYIETKTTEAHATQALPSAAAIVANENKPFVAEKETPKPTLSYIEGGRSDSKTLFGVGVNNKKRIAI